MEIGGTSIPDKEILFLQKTMYTMMSAGITTLEALKLCEDQTSNRPLKKFLNKAISILVKEKFIILF